MGHLYTNWKCPISSSFMYELHIFKTHSVILHEWTTIGDIFTLTVTEWDFVILHEWTAIGAFLYTNWVGFCDFTWMNCSVECKDVH